MSNGKLSIGFVLRRLALIVGTLSVVFALVALGSARFLDPRSHVYRHMVEADLRGLANAQERYREAHGRYAQDLGALDFVTSDGIDLGLEAVDDAWAATADFHLDQGFPFVDIDVRCALAVGEVEPALLGAADMSSVPRGQVLCEG